MKRFPKEFYWGAATASYQVEGGIDNCDWAEAARAKRVPPAGRLADHYNRYEQDFALAKHLGHNAHRFSIEWARIEPREGEFDERELDHYRAVLRALRAHNIEPFVTLWHFTLPQWLADKGGFEHPDTPALFARYCSTVVDAMGDLATHYATMNEPNVYATHGYIYGAWPPFKRGKILWKKIGKEDGSSERARSTARFTNFFRYFAVEKNLVNAHIQAYHEIKRVRPNTQVSVVKHVHVFDGRGWLNQQRGNLMRYVQTYRFMNQIIDACDEIGLNYYRHTEYGGVRNYLRTDMDWKVFPSGIETALKMLWRYKKPIYVAEAGLADADDDLRPQYIEVQVAAIWRAIQSGVDVRGHMYWSLLDNYEWALGITKRFGLVAVDYEGLRRTPRPSAYRYKEICEQNALRDKSDF